MADKCPQCGSENVAVGRVVLSCGDCNWNHLNKHPCDVCGQPSTSASGVSGKGYYRCSEHPMSDEEWRPLVRDWFAALRH